MAASPMALLEYGRGFLLPRSILPPSYEQAHGHARRIELASDRQIRERNKVSYRLNHWPIWILGALGKLPRVKPSTKGEGHERRYFYGSVWAVCIAQPVLWFMWKVLPRTRPADALKLAIFVGILIWVGNMARRGLLPRTRPIVPGELAVSD